MVMVGEFQTVFRLLIQSIQMKSLCRVYTQLYINGLYINLYINLYIYNSFGRT